MADGGQDYEPLPAPGNVPDAPPAEGKDSPGGAAAKEGKDDQEEKNALKDSEGTGSKAGDVNSKAGTVSKNGDDKGSGKGGSEKSGAGGKKKKKKKGKKEKKPKTAHFKKRGNPMFKILCMVFSVLSMGCLIGAMVCGIMIASNASDDSGGK